MSFSTFYIEDLEKTQISSQEAVIATGIYEGIRKYISGEVERNQQLPSLAIVSKNRCVMFEICEWNGQYDSIVKEDTSYFDDSLCLFCEKFVTNKYKNKGMYPVKQINSMYIEFNIPESSGLKYSDGGSICNECSNEVEDAVNTVIDRNRAWVLSLQI